MYTFYRNSGRYYRDCDCGLRKCIYTLLDQNSGQNDSEDVA